MIQKIKNIFIYFICKLFKNNVDWYYISSDQKLSEEFIREFKDVVYWSYISSYQKLSEEFIREFKDVVYWSCITKYQKLSEAFIREFKDNVNWFKISEYQKLSEDFIREFKNDVKWYKISKFQKLSEAFIREFKDNVDWNSISIYQKLSEDFIREFKDNVDWYYISSYQKLSEDFIKEFKLNISDDNWLYKDYNFKYNKIKNCNLYEIDGEYVIAFKGIRSDNYSVYNFQYQYLHGQTYECHANHNIDNENSFGLSAWTKQNALNYCSEKLIKVKIHINDIAALVHDNYKIRCSKFTVIG